MKPRPRLVVTGSVAFDYLMRFPGKFLDHFLPDRLHRISVSFLVDEMRRVRGGCAPNIAYSAAFFGENPILFGAAGQDARDYRDWLAGQGVDVERMQIFDDVFTASFFVSTDVDQNQIATFYAGAMARAREMSLASIPRGEIFAVLISPNDPEAMAAYARECRDGAIPFFYDPSQQVARLSGDDLRDGMSGATALLCNDYEFGVISQKTGMAADDIVAAVETLIVTHGSEGSVIRTRTGQIRIPPARVRGEAVDPTGVGDAYRGALLACRRRDFSWEFSGRVASVAAVHCLEALGPQPPRISSEEFSKRYRESFGDSGDLDRLFTPVLA
jgi:adenosine kinase